jgi:type IV secretory pathway TraG/TraD family ATPase VirD4
VNDDNTESRTFGPMHAYFLGSNQHCVGAVRMLRCVCYAIKPTQILTCLYSFELNFLDMNCTLRLKYSMWFYFYYNVYMSYCLVMYGTTALKCTFVICKVTFTCSVVYIRVFRLQGMPHHRVSRRVQTKPGVGECGNLHYTCHTTFYYSEEHTI